MNKPINPDFIEHLEELIATGRTCLIKFRGNNGGMITEKGKLANIYSEGDTEYLRTREGLIIKLQQLVEVEGRPLQYLA